MMILSSLAYITLISLLDALMYGVIYEKNQSKHWLFNPIWHYRICQKVIEIGGMVALYLVYGHIGQIVGLLLSFYFMTNERLYYFILGQNDLAKSYEKAEYTPHWLSQPYQFGWLLWKAQWWAPVKNNYSHIGFTFSAVMGLAAAVSLCLI